MFLAKFQQVTSDKFEADKNGNNPFIGEILAGTATGSLINGTIFQRDGLKTNTLYACDNFVDDEYPVDQNGKTIYRTRILDKVSLLEYQALSNTLGAGKLNLPTVANGSTKETATPKVAKV